MTNNLTINISSYGSKFPYMCRHCELRWLARIHYLPFLWEISTLSWVLNGLHRRGWEWMRCHFDFLFILYLWSNLFWLWRRRLRWGRKLVHCQVCCRRRFELIDSYKRIALASSQWRRECSLFGLYRWQFVKLCFFKVFVMRMEILKLSLMLLIVSFSINL